MQSSKISFFRMRWLTFAVIVLFSTLTFEARAQVGPNGAPPPAGGTVHSGTMTWIDPAPVSGVTYAGVNVYRGVFSGGPYGKLNTTPITIGTQRFVDITATPGTPEFAVLTSQTSAGAESAWSTEATYTLPKNGAPPTGLNVVVAAIIKVGRAIYAGLRWLGTFGGRLG